MRLKMASMKGRMTDSLGTLLGRGIWDVSGCLASLNTSIGASGRAAAAAATADEGWGEGEASPSRRPPLMSTRMALAALRCGGGGAAAVNGGGAVQVMGHGGERGRVSDVVVWVVRVMMGGEKGFRAERGFGPFELCSW